MEELQHLMDEFIVENLEDIDHQEENISNVETENNVIPESIQQNSILGFNFTEKKNIKWQKSPFPSLNLNLQPIYDEDPRVIGLNIINTPITYFSNYFSDVDFQSMVHYTNMYALQKGKPWKNADVREIRIFIGLHIIMGCTKFPRIRMYWNLVIKMNVFVENMNRNRFFALRTNFHVIFNLNINKNNNDKFVK